VGDTVDPLIGDPDLPPRQVMLQVRQRSERSSGQGAVLDVADAAFDLPLGAGAAGTAGVGGQSTVAAESLEAWIPDNFARLAIVGGHQRRCGVTEDLLDEAAEVPEGAVNAVEPIVLPLIEKCPAIERP
jgi:hypothetical protein